MYVDVEVKDINGTILTINGADYKVISGVYEFLGSDKLIIWRFKNRDIIINMQNVVSIIVIKNGGLADG